MQHKNIHIDISLPEVLNTMCEIFISTKNFVIDHQEEGTFAKTATPEEIKSSRAVMCGYVTEVLLCAMKERGDHPYDLLYAFFLSSVMPVGLKICEKGEINQEDVSFRSKAESIVWEGMQEKFFLPSIKLDLLDEITKKVDITFTAICESDSISIPWCKSYTFTVVSYILLDVFSKCLEHSDDLDQSEIWFNTCLSILDFLKKTGLTSMQHDLSRSTDINNCVDMEEKLRRMYEFHGVAVNEEGFKAFISDLQENTSNDLS
jgi:hypothetical protein